MSKAIYIVDGARTPIGRAHRSLKDFTAAELGAAVMKKLVRRAELNPRKIDEVFLGQVVSAGSGQNAARQAVLRAGLPATLPAMSVDNVCGAGLQSVILAARTIKAGEADLCLAGGIESATHCPGLVSLNHSNKDDSLIVEESLLTDGLTCGVTTKRMGDFVETLAAKHKITRRAQDEFTLKSHQKACAAQKQNAFAQEIVSLKNKKGQRVSQDDQPRPKLTLEGLKEFSSCFKKRGTLTAANSSRPSDGAAVVALASTQGLTYSGRKPLAKITGYVSVAADPKETFFSGIRAVKDVLTLSGLSVKNIDLFEVCESFAAQAILFKEKLRIPETKLNVHGGDVALGHPLGSAGTRILVTLLHALHARKAQRGLACVAFGGGGAMALTIEKE